MNISLIDFHRNPDLRLALQAQARRHRARHIVLLTSQAIAYLFQRKESHAARSHLARQG